MCENAYDIVPFANMDITGIGVRYTWQRINIIN
jgi:hypothetical protein